jgi:hypothetical protein
MTSSGETVCKRGCDCRQALSEFSKTHGPAGIRNKEDKS